MASNRAGEVRQVTRLLLWGRAAGRCQFPGCPHKLDQDLVAGKLAKNFAYVAHIVAASPGGVRGDPVLSEQLADDIENLMLLCDAHHREIDDPKHLDRYTVDALKEMKRANEERIDRLLSNPNVVRSHILRITYAIGSNETAIPTRQAVEAMAPGYVPAEKWPIDISLRGVAEDEADPDYYAATLAHLRRTFDREIRGRFADGDIDHLAVFGFAPMPLLIEFGRLLSDLSAVSVFARHREPVPSWTWPNDSKPLQFNTIPGKAGPRTVALKLSISAEISDERVIRAIPNEEVSIWSLQSDRLGTSVLRSEDDLSAFRQEVGRTLDAIRAMHGDDVEVSVFPAVPAACAIEFGRTWQPKAHPDFTVYDEVKGLGFVPRHHVAPI